MTKRSYALSAWLLGTAIALSGCHKAPKHAPANSLDAMDNALVESTPTAEGNSLGAAIKVDRAHTGHHAATEAVSAGATSEDASNGTCLQRNAGTLAHGNDWASKLPADLPLHPKAQLTEAAGHSGDCEVRIASFTVADQPEAVLAWYEDQAKKGGWDAGRTTRDGEVWLAGTKGTAAFTVMTAAKGDGTAVDYVWTSGN